MKNYVGELGSSKCVGKLGWVKWGKLELACPTACACLFKVRPGVFSKTLCHMWGKLNLPIFLFNVGLLTIIKIDSLIFLAKPTRRMGPFPSWTPLLNQRLMVIYPLLYTGNLPLWTSTYSR